MNLETLGTGLLLLLCSIIIIVFAYYITTIIGKKTQNLGSGRYTHVLERTNIGLNESVTIIKINKKIYLLIGQGKESKVMDIIEEEHWDFIKKENSSEFGFNKIKIEDIKKHFIKKK